MNWGNKIRSLTPDPYQKEREASPPTPLRKERGVITEKGNCNSR